MSSQKERLYRPTDVMSPEMSRAAHTEFTRAYPAAADLHARRCAADPMYHLLFFPRTPTDPNNAEPFISTCARAAIGMADKKYGLGLRTRKSNTRVLDALCYGDDTPSQTAERIFAVMALFRLSLPLRDVFEAMYDETPGNAGPFGADGRYHFKNFMMYLDGYMENMVTQMAYNKENVSRFFSSVISNCRSMYMCGRLALTTNVSPLG